MLRRQFIKAAGFGMLVSACAPSSSSYGSDDSQAPLGGGDCGLNGTSNSVGNNHGHAAPSIPAGDVNAGVQQTYIVGGPGHTHSVTVSAADFATLQGNNGVVITTDTDGTGHSHDITINCV